MDSFLQLCELHFAKCQENVVLAGKVVEKRTFSHVGSVGYVFDGGFGETLFREEIEGRVEQTFANVGATTLAAIGSRISAVCRRFGGVVTLRLAHS
jgi:hypothetical protein